MDAATPSTTAGPAPRRWGWTQSAGRDRFLIKGANLLVRGQGDALVVSFDNLATIDEGWPRGPWAWRRLGDGVTVLGVQSHARTGSGSRQPLPSCAGWRSEAFPPGVVLTGTSMGGSRR